MRYEILAMILAAAFTRIPADAPPAGLPVNVSANDVPLHNVMEQLGKQSGLRFSLDVAGMNQDNTPITLDVQNKPLWETLETIASKASGGQPYAWTLSDGAANPALTGLANQVKVGAHSCASGPFLVVARNVVHRADYSLPGSETEFLEIDCQVYSDPSVRISTVKRASLAKKATDDKGNSLIRDHEVPAPPDTRGSPLNQSRLEAFAARIDLKYPSEGRLREIASVDAAIPVDYQVPQSLEVPLDQPVEKHIDGATLSIEYSLSPPPNGPVSRGGAGGTAATLTIRATRDPAAPAQADTLFNSMTARLQASIYTTNGDVMRPNGSSISAANQNVRTWTYRYPTALGGAGTAAKAVIEVPGSLKKFEIPCHFEHLEVR